jgi:nitroimidazol reductase NimA-like FMN-containing flavoprotein (pyridoxamine 5'-phosphate oxidase superfamily)
MPVSTAEQAMSVAMSDEEAAAFLAERWTATIATINPSGMPLLAPMRYLNKGLELYFHTPGNTQKVKNLRRDPRVVAQVEDGIRYLELRVVILTGSAVEITDPAERAWFREAIKAKYAALPTDMKKMPKATQEHYAVPFVTFKVVPAKIKSWAHAKLRTNPA